MKYTTRQSAILLLSDGTIFLVNLSGLVELLLEVCFNTGMTGYQEIFTDPSYFGQSWLLLIHILVTMVSIKM
jgi:carbamoyl-phosphate synthase small subunit